MALIAEWRDFYAAVASAAAALLGLVFVGLSLHLSLQRASEPVRSLALGSAITLLFPMLVGLMMLIPVGAPYVHGFGAILLAVILGVELVWVGRLRVADGGDTIPWLVYRLGIPLGACGVLLAGGVGMVVHLEPAVAAPAAFVFALFVVGVQDAVDLLLGERGTYSLRRRVSRSRRGAAPPDPAHQATRASVGEAPAARRIGS